MHAARWLIGLVVSWALTASAIAGKVTPVEKLASDAAAAYRNGDYGKAAELLERAYQAQPVGTILYNLAKAYEKQGDNEKALDRYQRYLAAEDADAKYKARAEARVAALKELLSPKAKSVVEKPEPPPPPPPPVVQPPPPPAVAVDENWQRANRARRRDRGVGIALGVTGVVALAAGIGLTVNASSLHDQFDGTLVESDKRGFRDSAQTQLIVAGVLYGVGAAAIAVAGYFLYRGTRALPARRASITPRLGGLGVEVKF